MTRPSLYLADGPRYLLGSRILSAIPDWVDAPWVESRQSVESRLSVEFPLSATGDLSHTQPGRFVRQDFGERVVEWIVDRRSVDATRANVRLDLVPIHHLLRWAPIRRERTGFPADTAIASVNLNAREMIGSWVVPTMAGWGFDIFRTGRVGVSERKTVGMDGWTPLELMGWMADEYGVFWDLRADDDAGVYRIDFGWVEGGADYDVVLNDPGSLLAYSQSEDLSNTHTAVLVTGSTPNGGSQPSTLGTVSLRADQVASISPSGPEGQNWRFGVSVPGSDEDAVLEAGQWVGSYLAWATPSGIVYGEIVRSVAPGVLDLNATSGALVGTPVTLTKDTSGTRESLIRSPSGRDRLGAPTDLVGMVDGRGRGEQNYHRDPFHVDADLRGDIWDGEGAADFDYAGVYVGVRYPVPPRLDSPSLSSTGLPTWNLNTDGDLDVHVDPDIAITVTGFTVSTPAGGLEARLIVLEGSSFGSGTEIFNEDIGATGNTNHVISGLTIPLNPANVYTFRFQYQSVALVDSPAVRIQTSGVSYPYQTSTSEPVDIAAIVGSSEGSGTLGPMYNVRFTTSELDSSIVHGLPASTDLNAQSFNAATRVVARDFYFGSASSYQPRTSTVSGALTTDSSGRLTISLDPGEDADTDFTRRHYVYFFTGESNAPGFQVGVVSFPDGTSLTTSREIDNIGDWYQPEIPLDSSGTSDHIPKAHIAYRPPESMGGANQSCRFQGISDAGVLSLDNLPPGHEIWPGDIIQTGVGGTTEVFRCQAWSYAAADSSGEADVRVIWIDRHWERDPGDSVRIIQPPAIPAELIGQSHWVVCIQLLRDLSPDLLIRGPGVRRIPQTGSLPGVGVFAGAIQMPMQIPAGLGTQTHTARVERVDNGNTLASSSLEVDHRATGRRGQMIREPLPFTWPAGVAVRFTWESPDSAVSSRPFTFYSVGRNLFQTPDEEVPMIETSHANVLYSAGQRALRRHRYGLVEPTARVVDLVREWDLPTEAAERLRPGSRVRVMVPSVGVDEVFEVDRISRDGDGEAVVHFESRSNRISRQIPAPGRSFASVRYDTQTDQQTTEVQRTRPVDGLPAKKRPSAFFPDDHDGSDPSPPEVNLGYE
ncbi:MAG: hypothetical protein EA417_01780 [Gammaproteobacteria bacterium]|nr:MAG: hypothetical protein EA417_01780 [Gammaproteobacteria bacterium]